MQVLVLWSSDEVFEAISLYLQTYATAMCLNEAFIFLKPMKHDTCARRKTLQNKYLTFKRIFSESNSMDLDNLKMEFGKNHLH